VVEWECHLNLLDEVVCMHLCSGGRSSNCPGLAKAHTCRMACVFPPSIEGLFGYEGEQTAGVLEVQDPQGRLGS
jgi:hypothetical protein